MQSIHKIALLGGSGFIGTQLTSDLLKAGHDVTIGDIAPSLVYPEKRVSADVRNLESLLEICVGCTAIINLAAAHRDDVRPVSLYYDTNVTGARMTCATAEKIGIQTIIFTSSVAVYGHQHGEPDETAPHKPINAYGETKSQAEDVYREWFAKDPANRTLIIIRPTVVFGPRNRGNVFNLMQQVTKKHFVMVGDGTNKKSMAYVGNVSAFIIHALRLGTGVHIFNYVDKPDMDMNELVGLIKGILNDDNAPQVPSWHLPKILGLTAGIMLDSVSRITGKPLPISRVRVEKFCANTIFNADKVKATGFTPPSGLKTALAETIRSEFLSAKQQAAE